MWKLVAASCFLISAVSFADEPNACQEQAPQARVECHGRLRHGVVAIGGETTGCTITFEGLTWELKLPDEAIRTFAKEHHKDPVTAVGTVRKLAGHAKAVRWIVDVESLTERDASKIKEAATITVQGKLRAGDTVPGKAAEMELEAAGMTWPLDLTAVAALPAQAESLVGKAVTLTGNVVPNAKTEPPTPVIRVSTLNTPKATPTSH